MSAARGRTKQARSKAAPPRPDDDPISEEEIRSFTSWKLDLLETINADPATNPTDLAIVEAYLHFTRASSRTAFLSALDLRVRTGISSPETIATRRRRLVELGYLVSNGKTRTGVDVFRIVNARRNTVLDHVALAQEYFRERDAERKRRDRERRQNRQNVPPKIEAARGVCPTNFRTDVPPKFEDKHLEGTPVSPEGTERGARSQGSSAGAYARASRGC